MKALPPGEPAFVLTSLPTWIVFEVISPAGKVQLKELARVQAGSAPAAIVSAVETGADRRGGMRFALRADELNIRETRIHIIATIQ